MENKYLIGSLCPSGVDPIIHRVFREFTKAENGTLNGAYTKELPKGIEWVIGVFEGKLEEVECVDHEAQLRLTHNIKNDKNHILRKNERTDLTRLAINNVNIQLSNRVKHFLIDNYGTKYGSLSYLMNQAMHFYVKVKNGFIKLVKTNKEQDNLLKSDNTEQFNSINTNNRDELIELVNNRFKQLEQILEIKIESNVQSVFNISSKVGHKVKKIKNGTRKSGKSKAKLYKALKVLNNLMRWNEHGFTIKKYAGSLAKLTGQGDPRTPRSDLKTLENAGLIKKVRNNAHGTAAYEFIENNKYHLYNNDVAKKRFFDDVKEKFFKDDAFRLKELNDFIFEKYELFDAISQKKRLQWLISEGCVRRHDVNPHLLLIQK